MVHSVVPMKLPLNYNYVMHDNDDNDDDDYDDYDASADAVTQVRSSQQIVEVCHCRTKVHRTAPTSQCRQIRQSEPT